MERHRCKLCSKKFANGRALGGHMRSHTMNSFAPKNAEEVEGKAPSDENIQELHDFHLVHSYSFTPASSSSSEDEDIGEAEGVLSYEPKRIPKKTALLVDPELSFAVGSVQDWGGSETESSKDNPDPVCRRSKRVRQSRVFYDRLSMKGFSHVKKPPLVDSEPMSSISDTIPDEDVAYCLMMLSRDKWKRAEETECHKVEDDYYCSQDSGAVKEERPQVRGKYRCETCGKLFKSYQALGGHRASHNKVRVKDRPPPHAVAVAVAAEEKIHKCPFCHREFTSGQALGGHKRSHFIGVSAVPSADAGGFSPNRPFSRIGGALDIDLNLPAAPDYDDNEISQIAISVVSNAEFPNPH